MFKRQNFTIEDIITALDELTVDYCLEGSIPNKKLHFCSLRNPEPNGIYFAEVPLDNNLNLLGSLVIVSKRMNIKGCVELVVASPQLIFYKLMNLLLNDSDSQTGIHSTAIVDANAVIHPNAWIGPYCVLEECIIEEGVTLHSHVVVMSGTHISKNVTVESHSTIGATGVAWVWDTKTGNRIRQPQIGYTYVGEGTFLGTDITIVRGSVNETTSIGKNCVIAHGSKIGHGSQIGDECHFANNISIGGNVNIGKECFLGVACCIRPRVSLAPGTIVGIGAAVIKNNNVSGAVLSGVPAKVNKKKAILVGVPKFKINE